MKAFRYKIPVIAILLLVCSIARGGDYHTKKYNETFNVNANSKFEITNSFGNIDIKNTDDNTITIEAEIQVKASSETRAKKFFEKIDIEIKENGDIISAKTTFENTPKSKSNFEINYTVKMPASLDITLVNKYGNVTIDELTGKTNIAVRYGSLNANKIMDGKEKPLSAIELSYSEPSRINEFNWGKVALRYSKLKIGKGHALAISSKYSKLELGDFSSIVGDFAYDKVDFGKTKNLQIDTRYSDINIEMVINKLTLNSKYGDIDINEIGSDFEIVTINSSYGDIKIDVNDHASYMLDASTKFSDLKYPEIKIQERIKDGQYYSVKGFIGYKDAEGKMTIQSNFGDVKIE